jgi:hypothetical protein
VGNIKIACVISVPYRQVICNLKIPVNHVLNLCSALALFHSLIPQSFVYSLLADYPALPGYMFILSSKRANWNCHLSFYNFLDQLLLSIYPWLRNRCLAINNSSLLVSADMSHVSVAWQCQGWNIHISIFPQIFRPFGQNATFLPAYTLSYTIG